jgi:hypothetical protein
MTAKEIYKQETGLESNHFPGNNDYVKWLENLVSERYEPTILKWIKKMFKHAEKKQWFETYWSLDIHGTISQPDYRKDVKEIRYYPYAKETLQLMSKRKDIVMILWSSSYPSEIEIYEKQFAKNDIIFNFVGENPDVSSAKGSFGFYEKKHYFNVLVDDKAGFNPERDWKFLYDYFSNTKYRPDPTWSTKYNEEYHNK